MSLRSVHDSPRLAVAQVRDLLSLLDERLIKYRTLF